VSKDLDKELDGLLRELKLPGVAAHRSHTAARAEREGWSFGRYLHALLEGELEERRVRRLERALKASKLPSDKTMATLEQARLPTPVRRMLPNLCAGGFVDRAENLLAFGLPGRGKTHVVCAISAELLQRGYSVHFTPAFALVQKLMAAKKALMLEKELRRLPVQAAGLPDQPGGLLRTGGARPRWQGRLDRPGPREEHSVPGHIPR